jgi:hypothetical protein
MIFFQFDEVLCRRWNTSMKNGHFKYNLNDVVSRIIPGEKRYIVQVNICPKLPQSRLNVAGALALSSLKACR